MSSILIIAGFAGRFLLPRDRISFKKTETHPTFSVLIAAYREAEMMEQVASEEGAIGYVSGTVELLENLKVLQITEK